MERLDPPHRRSSPPNPAAALVILSRSGAEAKDLPWRAQGLP
jgi:hypothetical protein